MILQLFLLLLGFVILIKGADWLVDGGAALARKYKISELAIGLTVVAFGTSMPELVVNVFAASNSHSDIVFGNIIGSNLFNLLAILGITGLIFPLTVQSSTVWKEIPISFFAAILLFLLANSFISDTEIVSRLDGIILLIFFVLFLYYVFKQLKYDFKPINASVKEISYMKIILLIVVGLSCLVLGGNLVVKSSVFIAQKLGISQTIIGLTIVAAGTSLPELATSIVAAFRKNTDVAIGNIIGSNIFNIFFILGVSSLVKPVQYNTKFNSDIYLLGIGTILLFITMFLGSKKILDRWQAAVLLFIYIGYVLYLISKEVSA